MLTASALHPTAENARTPLVTHSKDLADVAEERLRNARHIAFQGVACSFEGGVLVLRGVVESYYLKQLAQSLVRTLDNVSRVENSIRVRSLATK
jgi:osmotically-inducible protein OsmY